MSAKMQVIKVSKNDLAVVQDILQNHIDDSNKRATLPPISHIEELLDDNRCYLFAATLNEIVVGYVLAYRFPSLYAAENMAYLYDIEVTPAYRRQGAGSLLIRAMITHLQADKVKEIWLGTGIGNPEGQGLFSATGAVKSEETFNDYTYYV